MPRACSLPALPALRRPTALAAALSLGLALHPCARAQDAPAPGAGDLPATRMEPIVITANPMGSPTLASPYTVLDGRELDLRGADNLGATLNGLPGVWTTTYGPMVGRPVIRGMDGDRVRIMNNGLGSIDASALSYDHAVPFDANTAQRIEIVRGPAALMYGGNAVGGVVNVIDDRIPDSPIDTLGGTVQGSWGGANDSRNESVRLEAGDGHFGIRADGYLRETGDLRIPGYARSAAQRAIDPPGTDEPYGTLPNSDGSDHGGGIGMAWTGNGAYAGVSANGYDSQYGSVAEDGVRLKMRQDRYAFSAGAQGLDGPLQSFKFDFAYTDYAHREIDDGVTGTVFSNQGYEARLEARHRDLGPLRGSLGLQILQSRFSALGDENLVPSTDTDSAALFDVEEWKFDDRLTLSAGGRLEYTRLSPSAQGAAKFVDARDRDFTATSFALGAVYTLDPARPAWSLASNLSYTQRAPTFYELYANGPHDATGQYLIGNPDLDKERSWSADLALRYDHAPDKGSFGVFYTRFHNYITEVDTGLTVGDDGLPVPPGTDGSLSQAFYRAVPAEFYGFEADSRWRVLEQAGNTVDLALAGDYTYAHQTDTGEPLPRIAPLRLRIGLDYGHGGWAGGVAVTKAFAQHSQPQNQLPVDGYYSLDTYLSYSFKAGPTLWQAYVKGLNLTNQDIRYATSILANVAPAGGRALLAGVKASF